MFQFCFFCSQKGSKHERQMDEQISLKECTHFGNFNIFLPFSAERYAPEGVKCNGVAGN